MWHAHFMAGLRGGAIILVLVVYLECGSIPSYGSSHLPAHDGRPNQSAFSLQVSCVSIRTMSFWRVDSTISESSMDGERQHRFLLFCFTFDHGLN